MKTEIKPFVSNFFELMPTEPSNSQEYDEKAQICYRSLENLKNTTSTNTLPTNGSADTDSDYAETVYL